MPVLNMELRRATTLEERHTGVRQLLERWNSLRRATMSQHGRSAGGGAGGADTHPHGPATPA